ncbi:MAG: GyrI-like domain-containing protein [Elusimicrobiota bacterium]
MLKYFLGALVLIGLGVVLFLGYAGFFHNVAVTEGVAGPYTLVYQKASGPYQNCAKPMDEVYKWLKDNKIETAKGFGIYFDNPQTVPQDKLRYIAGCIVDDKTKLKGLKTDFIIKNFKATKSVIAVFPFKNTMSIIAGVMKVYPAITKYAAGKKLPPNAVMEIYDTPGKTITYVMPVEKGFDGVKLYY